jgi:hypothetical protein
MVVGVSVGVWVGVRVGEGVQVGVGVSESVTVGMAVKVGGGVGVRLGKTMVAMGEGRAAAAVPPVSVRQPTSQRTRVSQRKKRGAWCVVRRM